MDIILLEEQLKALADANCLTLLSSLTGGEVCVSNLVNISWGTYFKTGIILTLPILFLRLVVSI